MRWPALPAVGTCTRSRWKRSRISAGSAGAEPSRGTRALRLRQFYEDASRRRGMQKGDALSFGADTWRLVDETDAGGAAAREGRVQIVDDEADVMNPRSSFGDELSDWRVRRVGLEQFDECVTGGKSGDARSIGI